jgi:hypothetical protein
MALTTSIPPQAYTRDILVKAIEWLSGQPPIVREKANSADLIVSYYLQANRRASMQTETPVSGETFKSDLRHLAQDLKQFEEPAAPPPPPSRLSSHIPERERERERHHEVRDPMPEPIFKPQPLPRIEPPAPRALTWTIDSRSLTYARDVQQRFNLSSEQEAVRMLVTLGAERLREKF